MSKRLVFSNYGPELNFDDANDMLENAIEELGKEIKVEGPSKYIAKTRGWNLETAHISVSNPSKYDGLDLRSLYQFLTGLKEWGWLFGFWEVNVDFWDDRLTVPHRGSATLDTNKPR